jgi:hypothetical protein
LAVDAMEAEDVNLIEELGDRKGFRIRAGRYWVIFVEDQTTILAIYIGRRETDLPR